LTLNISSRRFHWSGWTSALVKNKSGTFCNRIWFNPVMLPRQPQRRRLNHIQIVGRTLKDITKNQNLCTFMVLDAKTIKV